MSPQLVGSVTEQLKNLPYPRIGRLDQSLPALRILLASLLSLRASVILEEIILTVPKTSIFGRLPKITPRPLGDEHSIMLIQACIEFLRGNQVVSLFDVFSEMLPPLFMLEQIRAGQSFKIHMQSGQLLGMKWIPILSTGTLTRRIAELITFDHL